MNRSLIIIRAIVLVSSLFASIMPTFAAENILPWWQQQAQSIDDELTQLKKDYQQGNKEKALEASQKAHFTHYRNSDLEASIRVNYNMQFAETINQDFFELSKLVIKTGKNNREIEAITAKIQEDIAKALPDLPLTPRLLKAQQAEFDKAKTQQILNRNYTNDVQSLNQILDQALSAYQGAQTQKAMSLIQTGFYQYWQQSGLSDSVGSNHRKITESQFDTLFKAIQRNTDAKTLATIIANLQQTLGKSHQNKRKN